MLNRLRDALERRLPPGAPLCIAWSGGRDSTVLLHAAAAVAGDRPLRALHVDHGLQPEAAGWARHCEEVAAELGVDLRLRSVRVAAADPAGREAAARRARYRAFAEELGAGEALLTAHHLDDQHETVLLRLLRGAGPDGLAGIRELSRFGRGWLLRPLLGCSRRCLADYAAAAGLRWIEDPSNADLGPDRNYLRHEVIPRLRARWPSAAQTAARAAGFCAEATALLDCWADGQLATLARGDSLSLHGLAALEEPQQRLLLRRFLRARGVRPPGEARLRDALRQFVGARPDAAPVLDWADGQLRRYRGRVYLLRERPGAVPAPSDWDGRRPLELGGLAGTLALRAAPAGGLDRRWLDGGLQVRFRRGGERIRPAGARQHRRLKSLLQEVGVLPWMRARLPLLYAGEQLLAVAGLWLAADALAPPGEAGFAPDWRPRVDYLAAD
ncbi:MAG: tRNA lysidine(34) synthetase TilS [Gammaproteobacteria bacterium]|nr:MAG: tRNA lysidine(34) synthetase TilS [Gammaproteobacteria bacterium]